MEGVWLTRNKDTLRRLGEIDVSLASMTRNFLSSRSQNPGRTFPVCWKPPMLASARIACLECDLLLTLPSIGEGERAACPRCDHLLTSRPRDGLQRPMAYALSALILMVVSLLFPFLSLQASGLGNVMTLGESAFVLYEDGQPVLAALVLGFILVLPAVMLAMVIALVVPLRRDWSAPWLVPIGRAVFALGPWAMVEVFVIGVIVSLVKLASMAQVSLGISFWSYVGFALCFTATFASLDRLYLWSEIERVENA